MPTISEKEIISIIRKYPGCSSKDIFKGIRTAISYATVKRTIAKLIDRDLIITTGRRRGTTYHLSPSFELIEPIDLKKYFEREIDEREIRESFNFSLIKTALVDLKLFTQAETEKLTELQMVYERNRAKLTEHEYQRELERLAIDLSWKSSQIEGNTYSLLETERLLKEKETASGKTKEEAIMLLNHKEAIDFLIQNPDYLIPLSVSKIEDIHSILIKDLAVDRNIRKGRVGISGTNYRPLDNDFQIIEALNDVCILVNGKANAYEKALLLLLLISYIQPFVDGNKRTARIASNAVLMHYGHCPISFRTVDSVDYKKAMLLFYEQNNFSAFKEIFISQFEFAVNTYF